MSIKRIFSAVLFSLFTLLAVAQESAEQATEQSLEPTKQTWAMETKWALVAVLTIVIIIITLRTFRGKADV